jgi:hypothetical protein
VQTDGFDHDCGVMTPRRRRAGGPDAAALAAARRIHLFKNLPRCGRAGPHFSTTSVGSANNPCKTSKIMVMSAINTFLDVVVDYLSTLLKVYELNSQIFCFTQCHEYMKNNKCRARNLKHAEKHAISIVLRDGVSDQNAQNELKHNTM